MLVAILKLSKFVYISDFPHKPFAHILPIVAPALAIGLIGIGAGRITTGLSVLILNSATFLFFVPGVSPAL